MSDRSVAQLEWERGSEAHGPKFVSPHGAPPARLVVFGAVALTVDLTRAARMLGWVPYVVDPRERFACTAAFPAAEQVLTAWPREAFEQLGGPDSHTAVAALTHAPELDDEALILALRSPAFYVGAMGSRNTQRKRRERLAAAGLSPAELERLSGPAGLDLGGRTASEAALAILAEAVALRHGRSGARLTTSEQAIHAGASVIGGLVLAAGAGTRFGEEPKQLADVAGRPLLEWAVGAQCDARALQRVVVVLGSSAARIREAVELGRAEVVVCPDWETGQSASLRYGLAQLAGADKVVVTLGDAPLMTSAVIERFAGEQPGTRAVYDGRPGHPVVLGSEQIARLTKLDGDIGARKLLDGGPIVEIGHICSGRDVDTPEDLEEVRNEARAVL